MKHFKLFLVFIITIPLFAQNDILSKDRKEILKYSQEKIDEDSSKLKTDWINSITYSYTQHDGDSIEKSKKSLIFISQPIFKSGGIYYAIKYASSVKNSNTLTINLEEKGLIKSATSILLNIYKNELLIQKQELILVNNTIDIKQKKENVLNGLLDISFLNNAILDDNKQKENLLELKFQQTSLINSFNNLTAKSYKEFKIPQLKLLDKNAYFKNNIYIKQSKANSKTKDYLVGITKSKYLPTVNANYSYTENHTTNNNSNTYGFNVVIPLNIGAFNDVSSSKLDFLKSKSQEKITARIENNFLNTQLAKLAMIDKKIDLTKENIKSFQELLKQMRELEKAGLKTKDDVQVMENSKNSETLDTKIFSIDRQLELLELYARVTNAI